MLYDLSDRGKMLLIEITPGAFKAVSQFQVPKQTKGVYLAHPVICGKRLYLRHGINLYAYDIKAQ